MVVIDASSAYTAAAAATAASLIVEFCLGREGGKKRAESKTSYRLSLSLFLLKPGAYEGVKLKLRCTVAA